MDSLKNVVNYGYSQMLQSKFEIGDLVFACCDQHKPWPAKIISIINDSIYKVDFFNDNSYGLVDETDI